jgi:hypothetical protein
MVVRRALIWSFAIVGLGVILVAQAPVLDLKLGLWENTIVTNIGGAPPVDTSKMSPEQAAKIAEAMKGLAGDRTMTEKTCVKKEDLENESFMLPHDAKTTCTRTVGTNTRASFVADVTCTGDRPMKGQVNIQSLAGGTAFKGAVKMETSARGSTMNVAMTMSGKYLGPDCGSVK